jgi:high affinity Mn2+ porin
VAETRWTGAYVGGHVGYAGGFSDWSARDNGGAGPVLRGSLDFFKGFSFSKGTGSYFAGFQAGYNYLLPSNWVLGVEGDVSFPNTLQATRQFSLAAGGAGSYGETVEYFGSARVRIGYAIRNWLIYGTAGFAWSNDEFTRAQITGMPIGGTATAGTSESAHQWRTGSWCSQN